ncbi:STAS domain-containing protein [Umezawaea tangerina]|uniref:Anti-sigma factor antagonist n=1 Tax=Umezawaea tangerina TaxID=84725 RepID=A0A2T0T1L7_9PSEU|nr:STAS domain-containing protein [Umezawaea tangerina]PRY39570.1 anti-anti-sigma factor [Umezawaea tangerina]
MTSPGHDPVGRVHPRSDLHRQTTSSATVPIPRRVLHVVPDGHPPPLSVVVRESTQAVLLTVAGSIDRETAPHLHRALRSVLTTCPRLLVVDLTAVRLLACAGLSALVAAHRLAEDRTRVRVVAGTRVTRRPLALTGLDGYLSVYGTCAGALADPVHRS